MDAIGAQEWFAPVLTPDRAVGGDRPRQDPGDLPRPGPRRPPVRPAADARGDVHVPRARAAELQGAAAVLVPLPDQGPRRAAPARRPAPRPRVHHEGLVLVRPRRGRARGELPRARGARTTGSSSAAGIEYYAVQAESGMMGGSESVDFLAPSGSGENTLVTCENGDFAADLEVARAVPRAPEFPPRARRAGGDRDARRRPRSRRSPSCSAIDAPRRRRRCR